MSRGNNYITKYIYCFRDKQHTFMKYQMFLLESCVVYLTSHARPLPCPISLHAPAGSGTQIRIRSHATFPYLAHTTTYLNNIKNSLLSSI
jgi:hypothetical protein